MLDFLKKIFKREEKEREKLAISIEDIESWFDKKVMGIHEDIAHSLHDYTERISSEIGRTADNMNTLRFAKLHNPDITVREKQFMEGNREAYIKRVELFLKGLPFEKKDFKALKEACSSFSKELESLGKSTFKAYQVLQHFFANESKNIAINIKNIESIFKDLKWFLDKSDLEGVEEIKEDIAHLKSSAAKRHSLEDGSAKKSESLEMLRKDKSEAEKKLEELRRSREFKELKELLNKKNGIAKEIAEHKDKLLQPFSALEYPLRKYVRMVLEDEELLKGYINNPFDALLADDEFRILKIVEGLRKNVQNRSIELKDKKKEKALEAIDGLDDAFFSGFIQKYNSLEGRLREIDDKIAKNKAKEKEDGIYAQLGSINDEMAKISSEIEDLKKSIEKIDISGLKESLEKKIKEKVKVEIEIVG